MKLLSESKAFDHGQTSRIRAIAESVKLSGEAVGPDVQVQLEFHAIYDAHKLDGMGYVGIARGIAGKMLLEDGSDAKKVTGELMRGVDQMKVN